MAQLQITLSDEVFAKIQQLANEKQTQVEILAEDILVTYAQHELNTVADGIVVKESASISESDYPDWLRPAVFHGGQQVIGRDAEIILHNEWGQDK